MSIFGKHVPLVQPGATGPEGFPGVPFAKVVPGNPLGLSPEDRRYLQAEASPDSPAPDFGLLNDVPDFPGAGSALQEAVRQRQERARQELDQHQYEILRARLLSDPVVIDSLVAATLARLRMNRRAAAEREEANHRAALDDAMGVGGQG